MPTTCRVMVDGQQPRHGHDRPHLRGAGAAGDTLGVVVNLQDAKARSGGQAETLSRKLSAAGRTEGVLGAGSGRWMWWRRR